MNRLINRKNKILLILFVLFVLASCEQKTNKIEEWTGKISTLPELGTVEYVVSKVVSANDDATWYKLGDRKILFSCKAIIKAGIDLSKLTEDDIQANYKKKSITINLPKPELLSFNMQPEDIALVYSKIASIRSSFSHADRLNILTQGEKDIKEDIPNLGIIDDAEKNAKLFLEAFLKRAGYEKISIKFKEN
jgi:hypothetical protein